MNESWRFQPSIHPALCPSCSTSHFPFCPPPPTFNWNGGYPGETPRRHPPDIPPPFHRPLYDSPFPDHRAAPPPPPPARDPDPWGGSLPFEREPLRPTFFPRYEEFSERERESYPKRMRVEDPSVLGNFPNFPPPQLPFVRSDLSPSRVLSDAERRLNLIREHGQQNATPAFEDGVQGEYRSMRMDRRFDGTGYGVPPFEDSVRGHRMGIGIDHQFDNVATRNDHVFPPNPVFNHQNHPLPADPYEGYGSFPPGNRFVPQERRDFQREGFESSGTFGHHFGEHPSYGRSRQYDTSPQMPQSYRHGNPVESLEMYAGRASQGYRHDGFDENSENYATRAPQSYIHGEPAGSSEIHAARAPQGYNHGVPDESSENYAARDSQSYRRGDPVETSEHYLAGAPQGYRHANHGESSENYAASDSQRYGRGDPVETPENNAAHVPQGYKHDYPVEISENHSAHPPQSYRSGDHSESSEKYPVYASEERPFYDPKPLLDSYLASAYAPHKYSGPDHQQFRINENPPFLLPNHGQESNHMFHDMRPQMDKRFESHMQHAEVMQIPIREDNRKPFDYQSFPAVEQSIAMGTSKQGGYLPMPGQVHNPQAYPPLPPEPFPEAHPEPPPSNFTVVSSLPAESFVPSPTPAITPATMPLPPNVYQFSGTHSSLQADLSREPPTIGSAVFATEGLPLIHQTPPKQYPEDGGQTFPLRQACIDEPTLVDASHLFKPPHRGSRPDHFVVILRGLPGSGKSYLAKALRDIEVDNGGNAPRIHAIDDYFMIEVEKKVEDNDGSKSSSLVRGRKQIMKKVIEYCYEPEMEEAYRSSLLKAFKKTLDEGIFTFIIVDDRNLRVADFAQFWAIAKRSGYEVYLLEATYKDPTGCAARNVHGFTLEDIHKMAEKWEEAPPLYLQLDIQSLFHGDDLNEHSIQEVDMDTDDATFDGDDKHHLQDGEGLKTGESKSLDYILDSGLVKVGDRWDTEEEELTGVKELHKSKWSKDLDEDIENPDDAEDNSNALSGLMQAYGKSEKSVHWGDRVDKRGFSIGAVKKTGISSLVIGPGSGYNLNSNPIAEAGDVEETTGRSNVKDSRRRFHEQLRAERESFKAVFDRRRHRIGGKLDADDE